MVKVITASGFEFDANPEVIKDFKYIKAFADSRSMDVSGIVNLVSLVFGDAENALLEHVANLNDGLCPMTAVMAEFTDAIKTITEADKEAKKVNDFAYLYSEAYDELICDFASEYNIYSLEALPIVTIARLALGLREESRTMRKCSEIKYTKQEILLATIADRLALLVWMQSEDGRKNRNRPKSILNNILTGKEETGKVKGFDTKEDLDKVLAEFED